MAKQFGRSMIEMLAVLAVIGVISIGGVWGYRKAMTKHLANNVIDDINLSGFLIMDEWFHKLPDDDVGMDLTGKFDQKSPYTFKAFAETSSTFEILVQNVPYPVCMELKERELKDIDEIRANGFADECNPDALNEMSFFFDTDPTGGVPCETDSDCPTGCGKCTKNKVCRNDCEVTPDSCTSNDDCVDSGFCAGCVIPNGQQTGTCKYACTKVSYLESTEGSEKIDTGWYVDWDKSIKVSGSFSIPNLTERRIIIGGYPGGGELNLEQYGDGKFRVYIDGAGGIGAGGGGGYGYGFQVFFSNILPTNTPIHFSYEYNSQTEKHIYSANGETHSRKKLVLGRSVKKEGLFDDRGYTWGNGLKIYNISIKNGSTRMDLVPVLDPDGVPAMLDKVNQVLY